MWLLVSLALSTLVSEDLALIAAGSLVAQGEIGLPAAIAACVAGIFGGDLLLYLAGRVGGRWLSRLTSREALAKASEWMGERTFSVVFLSRFAPGLRLPVYVAAGALSRDFRRFATALFLAAVVWTPLVVVSSAYLGENMKQLTGSGWIGLLAPVATAAAAWQGALRLGKSAGFRRMARRLRGFLQRSTRWEFWPAWLTYLPVVSYILYLAIRNRSLTLFTAANPGIPCGGGVAGESKAFILGALARGGAPVARFAVAPHGLGLRQRIDSAQSFIDAERLSYPVVLKPDRGERGDGVAIVRSDAELQDYMARAADDVIVQEYVGGEEFGVFYCRRPSDRIGRIFSVTHKEFPRVTGDGKRTLEELILADPRAVSLASVYLGGCRRSPQEVIAAGEQVQLLEIGSHCRGAVFLDGSRLVTPALSDAVERTAQAMPGFYFGRFDVRSPSLQALSRGEFRILELNGVTAEAAHIYDPKISVREAYCTLFEQWRIAFEIGAENSSRGFEPESILGLLRIVRHRRPAPTKDLSTPWPARDPLNESA